MPIGSYEQHGPNGMIGTDIICPETIAAEVARRSGVMVGPSVPLGIAQHHLAFPGTVTLRPTTLIAMLSDIVESLARHGFRRFFFLNGHGGNTGTLQAAFAEIWSSASLLAQESRPRLELRAANWYVGHRVSALSAELFGEAEGRHATPTEISLSFHAHPERAAPLASLIPERAPLGTITDAFSYRERFPDGRIGSNPALASAAHGARILEAAVEDTLEALSALED